MRRGEAYPWGKPGRLLQAEKVDGAFDLTTIREVLPGMELREVRPEALARRRAALKTQIQRCLEEWHRFQAWLAEEEDTSPPSCHTPSRKGRICVTEFGIDRYRLLY